MGIMILDNNDLLTDVELVGQTLVVDHLHRPLGGHHLLHRLQVELAAALGVEIHQDAWNKHWVTKNALDF